MKYSQIITLSQKEVMKWNDLLNSDNVDFDELGFKKYQTIKKWTVKFENGFEADIKINTNGGDEDLFAEAVLFDEDGRQMAFTEPQYEIDGLWYLYCDGVEYSINIIPTEGE